MTQQQRRLVAFLIVLVLVIVGIPAGIIVWSATHRHHTSTESPATTTQTPTASVEPTSSTKTIESTPDQRDLVIRAATEAVRWSQDEGTDARRLRLSTVLTSESAEAPVQWTTLYGSLEGAKVTVDAVNEPESTYQNEESTEFTVQVTYTLHRTGEGDVQGTGLWTVTVPNEITSDSRASVKEPNGA